MNNCETPRGVVFEFRRVIKIKTATGIPEIKGRKRIKL